MINKTSINCECFKVISIKCDCCGEIISVDDAFEFQEIIKIKVDAGYGSVFGDGNKLCAEFCQKCAKKIFGSYLRGCNEND